MTMNGGFTGGFPGMPAAAPPAIGAPAGGAFILDIPPDPAWEPIEMTDTLEMDGYYCGQIIRENARQDGNKSPGVFLTIELQDEDVRGKRLSKFMTDPRHTQKNTWFVWRNLLRSITGNLDQARAGFRYQPGALTNQIVYFRTEPYNDDGVARTSIQTFVTKEEYDNAVKGGKHRWAPKPKAGAFGNALPGGLPAGFGAPGSGGLPLPGGPSAPTPQATAPIAAAPQQPAAQQAPAPPPGAPSLQQFMPQQPTR